MDNYDPLDIDDTLYAEFLREVAERPPYADPLIEPSHPLLANKRLKEILDHILREEKKLKSSYGI